MNKNKKTDIESFQYQGRRKSNYSASVVGFICGVAGIIVIVLAILFITNVL